MKKYIVSILMLMIMVLAAGCGSNSTATKSTSSLSTWHASTVAAGDSSDTEQTTAASGSEQTAAAEQTTAASGSEQTLMIMPVGGSEDSEGTCFTYEFFLMDQSGNSVYDATDLKVEIIITDDNGVVIYNGEPAITSRESTSSGFAATVSYEGLTASVNAGAADIYITAGGDSYNTRNILSKLPVDVLSEITISDQRTVNYRTTKGDIKSTLEIENVDFSYKSYSSGMTLKFDFTCKCTYPAGESGTYGGFYAVLTAKDGTELARKAVFAEIVNDSLTASISVNGYTAGTGATLTFEDYQ